MKSFKGSIRTKAKDYWKHLMRSLKEHKLSHGASNLFKTITSAHGDEWRRKNEKK